MSILKVNDVSFSYDSEKLVLKNVNMEFDKNIVYGVFGKSGAGKTTLLSLLAGLETTTSGTICYKDQDIAKINRDKYRSNEIGVIFQSYNLLSYLTALENVILSMDISNIKVKNKRQKALSLLKKVGLNEDKAKRPILHLSGGEQQRVAIARALAYDSEIILADEPTGNLDKENTIKFMECLSKIKNESNTTIVIVTHDEEVFNFGDNKIKIDSGKIIK